MSGGVLLPSATGAATHHDPDLLTLAKKLCRRLYRDLLLKVPLRVRIVIPIVLLVIIAAPAFRPRGVTADVFGGIRLRQGECQCPVYGDVTYLRSRLSKARTVFRGRYEATTKDRKLVVVEVEEVYRGPPRLGDFKIALPVSSIQLCDLSHVPKEVRDDERSKTESILIAGDLVTGSTLIPRGESQDFTEQPTMMFGIAHPLECGSVLAIPWQALAWEVVDAVENEGRFLETWWRYDEGDPKNRTVRLVESEWWLREGTSVVAACRDQPESVVQSLRNWMAVDGVDEIILVDWSSRINIMDVLWEHMPELVLDQRLQVVIVTVLRVNCNTLVPNDFIAKHPIERDQFYRPAALNDSTLIENENISGIIYARRVDLLAINGFDERVVSYGYSDIDLSNRAAKHRNCELLSLNDDGLGLVPKSNDLDPRRFLVMRPEDPFAQEVETTRNRILLQKMASEWGNWSRHVRINAKIIPHGLKGPEDSADQARDHFARTYEVTVANMHQTFEDAVGEAGSEEATIKALRFVLQKVGAPASSMKAYSKDFMMKQLLFYAEPEKHVSILGKLKGGCAARVLSLATLHAVMKMKSNAGQVEPYSRLLWDKEECSCKFTALFTHGDIEVYEHAQVKAGVTKDLIFPENQTYEVLESWKALVERQSAVNTKTALELHCRNPHQEDEAFIKAVRAELAELVPPDDTRSKSGEKPPVYVMDNSVEDVIAKVRNREFVLNWLSMQPSASSQAIFMKSYQSLEGAAAPQSKELALQEGLLRGCDLGSAPHEVFQAFPELTTIFASLLSQSPRCLTASIPVSATARAA